MPTQRNHSMRAFWESTSGVNVYYNKLITIRHIMQIFTLPLIQQLVFMRRKDEEDWIKSWEKQALSIDENYSLKLLSWFSPTARAIFRYSQHVGKHALIVYVHMGPQKNFRGVATFFQGH